MGFLFLLSDVNQHIHRNVSPLPLKFIYGNKYVLYIFRKCKYFSVHNPHVHASGQEVEHETKFRKALYKHE